MSKANEKSLKAKAYINGQVNKFREERRKTSDEEARKQLAENFRKTTSSKEYQEQLKIVHEDTDTIIKYAKRKKGGDITSKELKDTKTEFYGKNMNLEFGEDFEKLGLEKKVDYIFENFGDTDYAAYLIRDLLFKSEYEANSISYYPINYIIKKFGLGPVSLTLIFNTGLADYFKDEGQVFENITENTLTYIKPFYLLKFRCIADSCKDGSIGNHEILDAFINEINKNKLWKNYMPWKKLSIEGQKYIVDSFLKRGEWYNLFDSYASYGKRKINNTINLGNNIDVVNYICTGMMQQEDLGIFFPMYMDTIPDYHKVIANILIQQGRIDIVKNNIDYFTGLTEEEKAEILGNTELEDRLNREKFDADLVKLRELGEKLGLTVKVEEKKEE